MENPNNKKPLGKTFKIFHFDEFCHMAREILDIDINFDFYKYRAKTKYQNISLELKKSINSEDYRKGFLHFIHLNNLPQHKTKEDFLDSIGRFVYNGNIFYSCHFDDLAKYFVDIGELDKNEKFVITSIRIL